MKTSAKLLNQACRASFGKAGHAQKPSRSPSPSGAFTLIELLVVIAIIAILAAILLPVLNRAKIRGQEAQCIANQKQLVGGAFMYAQDNADFMLPNAPSPGAPNDAKSWCGLEIEGWGSMDANTNYAYYNNSILGQYMTSQVSVYHCPGDWIPSANGMHIRSYSMNGMVGDMYCAALATGDNPQMVAFSKVTDLGGKMSPSDCFVFCEENFCSLDDGWLQMASSHLATGTWGYYPNIPSAYHAGTVCGFSFYDGHAEEHKWLSPDLPAAVQTYYANKQTKEELGATAGIHTKDWQWLATHTTVAAPNATVAPGT